MQTLPALLGAACIGGLIPLARGEDFSAGWFLLTLGGLASLTMGAWALNDFFDEASGVDRAARADRISVQTGSLVVSSGEMTPVGVLAAGAAFTLLGAGCGIALALVHGWPVLVLGAGGFALAFFYAAPPVAYANRGLGELGIFLALGPLPAAGAAFVQTGRVEAAAVWLSLPAALMATLVIYNHNLLHWRGDDAAGRRTLFVILGPERALVGSAAGIAAAQGLLITQVALGDWHPFALAALVSAPPLWYSFRTLRRNFVVQSGLNFLGATVGSAFVTNTVLAGTLLAEAAFR